MASVPPPVLRPGQGRLAGTVLRAAHPSTCVLRGPAVVGGIPGHGGWVGLEVAAYDWLGRPEPAALSPSKELELGSNGGPPQLRLRSPVPVPRVRVAGQWVAFRFAPLAWKVWQSFQTVEEGSWVPDPTPFCRFSPEPPAAVTLTPLRRGTCARGGTRAPSCRKPGRKPGTTPSRQPPPRAPAGWRATPPPPPPPRAPGGGGAPPPPPPPRPGGPACTLRGTAATFGLSGPKTGFGCSASGSFAPSTTATCGCCSRGEGRGKAGVTASTPTGRATRRRRTPEPGAVSRSCSARRPR